MKKILLAGAFLFGIASIGYCQESGPCMDSSAFNDQIEQEHYNYIWQGATAENSQIFIKLAQSPDGKWILVVENTLAKITCTGGQGVEGKRILSLFNAEVQKSKK